MFSRQCFWHHGQKFYNNLSAYCNSSVLRDFCTSSWLCCAANVSFSWSHCAALGPPKKSLVSARVASDLRVCIFNFLFVCYETISNCNQNCWIDWNSAALCFKGCFSHRGMNICPNCKASLSHHTLYMGNLVPAFSCRKITQKNQARSRTNFEANL